MTGRALESRASDGLRKGHEFSEDSQTQVCQYVSFVKVCMQT